MRKKTLALMVALMLVFLPILTLAQAEGEATEEERVAVLSQLVEDCLTREGYRFSHREDEGAFYFDQALDNALSMCQVRIDVKPNQLSVLAFPAIGVSAANRVKVAKLISLINWNHFYAQMYMDMDTGEMASGSTVLSISVYPGLEEIRTCLDMSLYMLKSYGDAIARVAMLGEDPQSAFDAAKPFE